MVHFLDGEKAIQTAFKKDSPLISQGAKSDGLYKKKYYPFCLPQDYSQENLYPEIRLQAMKFFHDKGIPWHDGPKGKPSNHPCSSQVCCVNFLFPLALAPQEALVELLQPIYPTIDGIIPMEDNLNLTFEWIGLKNYLGEKETGLRTRGAHFTSADAALMFKHTDGRKQIVLIEWKYTESYQEKALHVAQSGTDRTKIYKHLYEDTSCPINKTLIDYKDLFYEPFYQLFRQQLLANEMEKPKELGADIVSLLHIAPAGNLALQRVTSPGLKKLGKSATYIWSKLQARPNRFRSVSTQFLFGNFPVENHPDLSDWWDYISSRYSGII